MIFRRIYIWDGMFGKFRDKGRNTFFLLFRYFKFFKHSDVQLPFTNFIAKKLKIARSLLPPQQHYVNVTEATKGKNLTESLCRYVAQYGQAKIS